MELNVSSLFIPSLTIVSKQKRKRTRKNSNKKLKDSNVTDVNEKIKEKTDKEKMPIDVPKDIITTHQPIETNEERLISTANENEIVPLAKERKKTIANKKKETMKTKSFESNTPQLTQSQTNNTLQEELQIIQILNQCDNLQIKNEINVLDKHFNKLQASIAMDQLKPHWKSKYSNNSSNNNNNHYGPKMMKTNIVHQNTNNTNINRHMMNTMSEINNDIDNIDDEEAEEDEEEEANINNSNGMNGKSDKIQVLVRVCPLLPDLEYNSRVCTNVNSSLNSIPIDEDVSQESIFLLVGKPITNCCLRGYNGTIFAYGQTGSGKIYAIEGSLDSINSRGLMARVFDYLFCQLIRKRNKLGNDKFDILVKCSCLEIYNEKIQDLFSPEKDNLQIRKNLDKGVFVENLTDFNVCNAQECIDYVSIASSNRRVANTSMNKESSRSHLIFTLIIQCKDGTNMDKDGIVRRRESRFNMIGITRLREAGAINKSLHVLGHVMKELTNQEMHNNHNNNNDGNDNGNGSGHGGGHYRDSKLTHFLKDSIGGNSLTFMTANISPSSKNMLESTLESKRNFIMNLKLQLKLLKSSNNNSIKNNNNNNNDHGNINNSNSNINNNNSNSSKGSDPSALIEDFLQKCQEIMDFLQKFVNEEKNKIRHNEYCKWKNTYWMLIDENEQLKEMNVNVNNQINQLKQIQAMQEMQDEQKMNQLNNENDNNEQKEHSEEQKQELERLKEQEKQQSEKNAQLQESLKMLEEKYDQSLRNFVLENEMMQNEFEEQLGQVKSGAVHALNSNVEEKMSLKMEIAQLKGEITHSSKEINKLNNKLIGYESEIHRYKSSIEHLNDKISQSNIKYDTLMDENSLLNDVHLNLQSEYKNIESLLQDKTLKFNELETELSNINNLNNNIMLNKNEKEELLKQTQKNLENSKTELSSKLIEINKLKCEIKMNNKQIETILHLETSLARVNKSNTYLKKELNKQEKLYLSQKNTMMTQLKNAHNDIQTQQDRCEHLIKTIEQRLALRAKQLEENRKKTECQKMRLSEEKVYHDMLDWKRKHNQSDDKNSRSNETTTTLKSVISTLENENTKLAGHHNSQQRINHLINVKKECEMYKREQKELLHRLTKYEKQFGLLPGISSVTTHQNRNSNNNNHNSINNGNKSRNDEMIDDSTFLDKIEKSLIHIATNPSLIRDRSSPVLMKLDVMNNNNDNNNGRSSYSTNSNSCFQLRYRSGQSISDRTKKQFNFKPNMDNNINDNNNNNTGMIDCKSSKCKTCKNGFDLLCKDDHWHCETINKKYKIMKYSCNNRFVVYVIYCDKCGMYYIGSSIKTLRTRAGQHRRKICSGCNDIVNLLNAQPQPSNTTTDSIQTGNSPVQTENNKYHRKHNPNVTQSIIDNDVSKAASKVYDHFQKSCIGDNIQSGTPPALQHVKVAIIDSINPKYIYLWLNNLVDDEFILHELFKLELRYQGETLAFIHGLNSYIDWNCTTGLRRGDTIKRKDTKPTNPINCNKIKNHKIKNNMKNIKRIRKTKLSSAAMLQRKRVRIILTKSDFDNIFGLNEYLSRTEYIELLDKKQSMNHL